MSDVVSFRPSAEELESIEKARLGQGLATRAEAVRYLLRRGAAREGPLSEDPVFKFRLGARPRRRTLSSRELDEALYGRRG